MTNNFIFAPSAAGGTPNYPISSGVNAAGGTPNYPISSGVNAVGGTIPCHIPTPPYRIGGMGIPSGVNYYIDS